MNTPIADFVKKYSESGTSRLHMPGHKGHGPLGCESLDITEIKGADALYEASGIIEKSESNVTALFGTQKTVYSTEGSSQCIRAMLYLAMQAKKAKISTAYAAKSDKYPQDGRNGASSKVTILAARNVHKSFLYGAALLDLQVEWLYNADSDSVCSCIITPDTLKAKLSSMEDLPAAVYITSPDYLGGMSDVAALAAVCHEYGVFLLVDNAHGAYLRFLTKSLHPMDLGADMCCDSAHKTLPVLTGGAYLHISKNAPKYFAENVKQAMALFGSTSPSYLILQSLDLCNGCLADVKMRDRLKAFILEVDSVKKVLSENGWDVVESDPLKIVIRCKGTDIAGKLREAGIECEFADCDYLVLMLTPENVPEDLDRLVKALGNQADKDLSGSMSAFSPAVPSQQAVSLHAALFSPHETIDVHDSVGRICGTPLVSCPPAVPIVISGERITKEAVALFDRYGITEVDVVIE